MLTLLDRSNYRLFAPLLLSGFKSLTLRLRPRPLRVPSSPVLGIVLRVVPLLLLLHACAPATPSILPEKSESPPAPSPTLMAAPTPTNAPLRPLDPSSLNILFIGSSHVTLYDLPGMFVQLAEAGGYQVNAEMYAASWISLEDHATDPQTFREIGRGPWDYVVLQDDFRIAADREARELHMFPPAQALDNAIKFVGARTIFFMTWGDPRPILEGRMSEYLQQQRIIAESYLDLGRRVGSLVAPVGLAVERVLLERPDLYLWLRDDDFGHANILGTYLAASVHYAVIYQESPEGLSFVVQPEETSRFLQSIAAETVLGVRE